MVLLSHPTGNQNVRAALSAFEAAGLLELFVTALAFKSDTQWMRALPLKISTELRRRTYPIPRSKIHTFPYHESIRLIGSRLGLKRFLKQDAVDLVYSDMDRKVAGLLQRSHISFRSVYAYEDGALETFRVAQQHGVRCFYELPIGYWKAGTKILEEDAQREPEWASTLGGSTCDLEKIQRKDEELALADVIFVASQFVKKTLEMAPLLKASIEIIPYGCPPVTTESASSSDTPILRVLFVGGLSQRKGLSYLLKAVDLLGNLVSLTLIGRKMGGSCTPLERALTKHRWIPTMPHHQVLEEMRRHDVLVFPSLFEGFGLVITEALSQGLPVITTSHTGGVDILTNEVDGFLVPIRDPNAIAEKLEWLLRDRSRLAGMKEAALNTARRLTWKTYQTRLVAAFRQFSS
jgi:alpha-maltose-1-phosphate synthase